MIQLDTIYNMDCLEGMKLIPDGSVDCIICDLPYGTTACKWDNIIPFEPLWEQYRRIIKPNGAIVLFGSEPFSTKLRASNIQEFRYDWIWEKSQGADFMHAKIRPLKKHEIISVFCKKGCTSMTYNPQGLKRCHKLKSNDKKFGTNYRDWGHDDTYVQEFCNYPTSVLRFALETSKYKHATRKPVGLLEYLVRTYTHEGETVLDNCSGSGTTAIACIRANRHYIGFETDKDYYDMSLKRILDENEKEPSQLTLNFWRNNKQHK